MFVSLAIHGSHEFGRIAYHQYVNIHAVHQFALVTRRQYCPGGPKKLCFTTLSLIPMVSIARLSVIKQSSFGLPGQYGRRVTRVNCTTREPLLHDLPVRPVRVVRVVLSRLKCSVINDMHVTIDPRPVQPVNHCFTTCTSRTSRVKLFTGRICSTVLDKDGHRAPKTEWLRHCQIATLGPILCSDLN